jgi:hypothetical protein
MDLLGMYDIRDDNINVVEDLEEVRNNIRELKSRLEGLGDSALDNEMRQVELLMGATIDKVHSMYDNINETEELIIESGFNIHITQMGSIAKIREHLSNTHDFIDTDVKKKLDNLMYETDITIGFEIIRKQNDLINTIELCMESLNAATESIFKSKAAAINLDKKLYKALDRFVNRLSGC